MEYVGPCATMFVMINEYDSHFPEGAPGSLIILQSAGLASYSNWMVRQFEHVDITHVYNLMPCSPTSFVLRDLLVCCRTLCLNKPLQSCEEKCGRGAFFSEDNFNLICKHLFEGWCYRARLWDTLMCFV